MADPLQDLMFRPPQNPVTPTLQQLMSGARTAGNVAHSAVVEPVQEMGRGLSDLMAGRGVTPEVGSGLMAAMGLLTPMRAGALAKPVAQGIRAYHGSPYKFDKFSLDKIGTGEGAQAYGHGLYFADNEAVARSYRDQLADKMIGGKAAGTSPEHLAAMALSQSDRESAIRYFERRISRGQDVDTSRVAKQLLETKAPLPPVTQGGHMYEVNINARPEQFLDWDKPLSGDVGQRAQETIFGRTLFGNARGRNLPEPSREEAARLYARDPEGVSNLREAGIPGIKYLDQGSRDAGQGSSNYVVFDDSLIDIMKRYGLMGGAAAPVLAGAGDQQ